jgi:hypothetical protein
MEEGLVQFDAEKLGRLLVEVGFSVIHFHITFAAAIFSNTNFSAALQERRNAPTLPFQLLQPKCWQESQKRLVKGIT